LEQIVAARKEKMPADSYTTSLFERGTNKIAQKVGEEGVEVVIAALGEGREAQINEIADLHYHLLVLMAELGISLADIEAKLRERHQK